MYFSTFNCPIWDIAAYSWHCYIYVFILFTFTFTSFSCIRRENIPKRLIALKSIFNSISSQQICYSDLYRKYQYRILHITYNIYI